ncbi:MAG: organomercurial lyase, partial [Actinomycetota bacterium]|nr:organomercurial lyase [Actinomycetota bacterium]
MAEAERIERLADRLIAVIPALDPGEQTVAVALLRMLAKGEPVSEQALAAALGVPESGIRLTVGSWPGVFREEDQRIIGFMGLSVGEFGDHRVEVDGRTLTAWCAWDTLFLPQL